MPDSAPISIANPVFEGFLLKRAFIRLSEGVYLVSGDTDHTGVPRFAAPVAPHTQRESQWQQLRKMRLSGRRFWAFRSCEEYSQWRKRQTSLARVLDLPINVPALRIH